MHLGISVGLHKLGMHLAGSNSNNSKTLPRVIFIMSFLV